MSEPIRIELEGYECPCPSKPHTTEWVELEPAATIPMGMAVMARLQRTETNDPDVWFGEAAPLLMQFGIRRWSFIDEKKGSVPVNPTTIAQYLPFGNGGYEVANRCTGLYLEEISRPLVRRRTALLASMRTVTTTSQTPPSGSTPLTPRSRSSRKSTAGQTSEAPAP
jgi:hypothetical protein